MHNDQLLLATLVLFAVILVAYCGLRPFRRLFRAGAAPCPCGCRTGCACSPSCRCRRSGACPS